MKEQDEDEGARRRFFSRVLHTRCCDLCEGGIIIAYTGIWQGPRHARIYCGPQKTKMKEQDEGA